MEIGGRKGVWGGEKVRGLRGEVDDCRGVRVGWYPGNLTLF